MLYYYHYFHLTAFPGEPESAGSLLGSCPSSVSEENNNKQQQQPFYSPLSGDYLGEPVPEETLTHPPS